MNLLVLSVIICETLHRTEAANTFNAGNTEDHRKVEESVSNARYKTSGNNGILDTGFGGNLDKIYGRNTWLLPNRTPLFNGSPQNPFLPRKNGFNLNMYGNSIWNRPTSRPTYPAMTGNTDDIDPEVAKQFPELVDLLNRLRELNKLKDEGKLPIGGNVNINGQTNKPNNGNTGHKNNITTIPNNNGQNNMDGNPADKSTLIVISDGKVYFQAQPVVPENERKKMNETIYYVKS